MVPLYTKRDSDGKVVAFYTKVWYNKYMITPERSNPFLDAFSDVQAERVAALIHSDEFTDALRASATTVETTLKTTRPICISGDLLPLELEELIYVPQEMRITNLVANLLYHPDAKLWSFDSRFEGSQIPYKLGITPDRTLLEFPSADSQDISLVLPTLVGFQFFAALHALSENSDLTDSILRQPGLDPSVLSYDSLETLIKQIGASYGNASSRTEARVESLSEFSRVGIVNLAEYDSREQSAAALSVRGAIDFGAKESGPSTTAIDLTYKEAMLANSGISSSTMLGRRYPSDLPIESYLQLRELFGGSGNAPDIKPSENPRLFGQIATSVMLLIAELYEDGLDTPDAGA